MQSLGRSEYILVIIDDYFRFACVFFLKEKSKAFKEFSKVFKHTHILKNSSIVFIKSDHGRKFDKKAFIKFVVAMAFLITFLPHVHFRKIV